MRTIIKERLIKKSREYLYNKWTTNEGLNSFFSADNDIEIKPNGKYEIYFTSDTSIKERGSEGCTVLSFIPNRMFSFTWNTPPQFKDLRYSGYYTWVVLEFIEIENGTLVRLTNLGYPNNEAWDKAYKYFDKAWDYVLDNLVESCIE
ncbi:MAG TPA: SRPBCC domain-containing protein [Acholeplasmataceae bacterium]|jgi:uncharacterized protein YndB with AHSA1/START domain|nr:SRPBCC domain-containing protein [Acholeplasmataceae bacterium]